MRGDQALLSDLGRRVRAAREARGLTVSELAREAGLSRRHVTETEAGRANLSFLKLARLAHALGAELAALCAIPLRSASSGRIALVGLRGAGKSSVGRALALEREIPFIELDERVEVRAGMSLAELFDLHGVDTYRRLEAEALEDVLASGEQSVIATGGSIVTANTTFERLKAACRTVWLHASADEHLARVEAQGDRRPMAGRPRAREELRALLDERRAAYASCELSVDTSGRSVEEVVRELQARLGN